MKWFGKCISSFYRCRWFANYFCILCFKIKDMTDTKIKTIDEQYLKTKRPFLKNFAVSR